MKKTVAVLMLLLVVALFCGQQAMAQDCTDSAYYHDTIWKSHNLETGFTRYFYFKKDGNVGFSKIPDNFTYDGTDTWRIVDGVLVLIWSDGYAIEVFRTDRGSCELFKGKKSSKKWEGEKDVRLSLIKRKKQPVQR